MVAGGLDPPGAVADSAASSNALIADDSRARGRRDQEIYDWATEVLFEVRKQRSEAKQPLKVPITQVSC